MKYKKYILIFILLICSELYPNVDEEEVVEKLALIQNTANSGRDFWFTIPPILLVEGSPNQNLIKVLVVSTTEANVEVSILSKNYNQKKQLLPNQVESFDISAMDAQPLLHNGIGETVKAARVYNSSAIHVQSDVPILVYVIVKFKYTSDGFFAIPTHALGTKYINAAYNEPDFDEIGGWLSPFTGVVGVYDNTNITFTKGSGYGANDVVPFQDGSLIRPGRKKDFSVSKGDVMFLSIYGKGQDLSGSIFEADKPFAIVSGVNCASVPMGEYSCDYLVEMEIPVKNWGENYFVTPLDFRNFNGIVRVFASEDSTKIYKDGVLISIIPKGGGADVGEGYLEFRLWPKFDDEGEIIPPKVAHIRSNKPINVVYYNTSGSEDSVLDDSDPFMMQIPPMENAVKHSVLFSPNKLSDFDKFKNNFVSITFSTYNDEIPDDLLIAEQPPFDRTPKFEKLKDKFGNEFNKFKTTYNGKNFGSKVIPINQFAAYIIKSDSTIFVTESYGYSTYEPYGFPSSFNLRVNNVIDTIPPLITYKLQPNGEVLIEDGIVTDLPFDSDNSSGLADIYIVENKNYELTTKSTAEEFIPGVTSKLNWSLTVVDKSKPASAKLYAIDMAGNDTVVVFERSVINSIESKPSLAQYITITQSNIEVLPQALADGFTELLVFDINGNRLLNSDIASQRNITLSQLTSGTYFATLKNGERIVTQKFVVAK